jgi:undecaprenyl-diphosphatase
MNLWAWDAAGLAALNQFVGTYPSFDEVMLSIARNHLLRGGLIVGMLWWCWTSREGIIDFFALKALSGAVLAIAVGRGLQNMLPARARPLHDETVTLNIPDGMDTAGLNGWSSFPSDTTILFFALAMAIWSRNRRLGLLAFAWSAIVICLPRVYFGFHYPSDILVGAIIGIAIMLIVLHISIFEKARPIFEWTQHQWPKPFMACAFLVSLETANLFEGSRRILRDLARLVIT